MNSSFALLRIRVQPEDPAEAPAEWVGLNNAGAVLSRGVGTLSGLPAAELVELIVPASRVSPHRIEIPVSSSRFEAALIRQALEDRVLGDLDRSVIVSGARQEKWLTVWVADRDWLGGLLADASKHGVVPARLTPEQVLLEPGQFAESASGWILQRGVAEYGLFPTRALMLSMAGADLAEQLDLLANPGDPRRVNLIAGLPRLKRAAAGFSPQLFKPAAVLLIAAALLYLLAQTLVWRQLVAQENSLRQAIRQNFAAARPGVPIVDPILQWRQGQGKPASQGQDALDTLAGFAVQTGITLHPQRIEVDDVRLKLTLTVAEASALKPVLQQKNIAFESGATDSGLAQITVTQKAGGRS